MKAMVLFTVFFASLTAMAQSTVKMGFYSISTTPEIAQLLHTDGCARTSVNAVKTTLNRQAVEQSQAIQKYVSVTFLMRITPTTFSVTMDNQSWLVPVSMGDVGCRAGLPYKAGTGGSSVGNNGPQ
jgi:hypothetical protein